MTLYDPGPEHRPLTARQLEVLRLLRDVSRRRAVAAALGVSLHTARHHIKALYERLGVHDRTQAVMAGIQRGWIEL